MNSLNNHESDNFSSSDSIVSSIWFENSNSNSIRLSVNLLHSNFFSFSSSFERSIDLVQSSVLSLSVPHFSSTGFPHSSEAEESSTPVKSIEISGSIQFSHSNPNSNYSTASVRNSFMFGISTNLMQSVQVASSLISSNRQINTFCLEISIQINSITFNFPFSDLIFDHETQELSASQIVRLSSLLAIVGRSGNFADSTAFLQSEAFSEGDEVGGSGEGGKTTRVGSLLWIVIGALLVFLLIIGLIVLFISSRHRTATQPSIVESDPEAIWESTITVEDDEAFISEYGLSESEVDESNGVWEMSSEGNEVLYSDDNDGNLSENEISCENPCSDETGRVNANGNSHDEMSSGIDLSDDCDKKSGSGSGSESESFGDFSVE